MTRDGAQSAINSAALVTAGIYFYRKLIEPAAPAPGSATRAQGSAAKATVEELLGRGPVAPVGHFIVGWGATFLICSLIAPAAPEVGAGFALLAMAGAVLGNGVQVSKDINTQLSKSRSQTAGPSPAAPSNQTVSATTHPFPTKLQSA